MDYLFQMRKPQELETYQTLTGAEYSMPASDSDIFLHIRGVKKGRL